MTFKVLITGKPCSGKTTQAHRVAGELVGMGVHAIAIGKKTPKRDKTRADLSAGKTATEVAAKSLFIYLKDYFETLLKKPDILIFQRMPLDFFYALELHKGDKAGRVRPLGKIANLVSRTIRPDLVVHLNVANAALVHRFQKRPDNHDTVHQGMMRSGDERLVSLLRDLAGAGNMIEVNGEKDTKAVTKDIISAIQNRMHSDTQEGA